MAKADYWCCEQCDEKVIYDGDNRIGDEVAARMNVSEKDSWKIVLTCHKCTDDNSIKNWYNDVGRE